MTKKQSSFKNLTKKSKMCKYTTKSQVIPKMSIENLFSSNKFDFVLTKSLSDNTAYILKTYPILNNNSSNDYLRENSIHSTLNHPNIIQHIPSNVIEFNIPNYDFITMEYAPFGDFFNLTIDYKIDDIKLIRTYFHQLIEGLQHIHSKGIAHLDIKLENLLLGKDYRLKIADFDLAQLACDTKLASRGTMNYRPFEVKQGTCSDFYAADVYSVGVCLFTLIAGFFPFLEEENFETLFRFDLFLKDNEAFWKENEALENGQSFSLNLRRLLNGMWRQDPSERLTLEQIKESEWYKEPIYSQGELEEIMKLRLSSQAQ